MMEKFESEITKLNEDVEFTDWISAEEDARKVTNTLMANARKEGLDEGISQGISEGLIQGSRNKTLETAKKMLEDELDYKMISKYTGLTHKEIKNIEKGLI